MGTGKSTVGRALARRLDLDFRDADEEIERAAGKPIPRIFAEDGEPTFRALERDTIVALLALPTHVLATGGGAVVDAAVRAALKASALTIWLRTDPAILERRLAGSRNRPLLRGRDVRAVIDDLSAQRDVFYAQADFAVASQGTRGATVWAIVEALARFKP